MNKWRNFWHLPPEERAVFLAALGLLPAVRVGLRTLGFRRVLATLDRRLQAVPTVKGTGTDFVALRTARLVAVAARIGDTRLIDNTIIHTAATPDGAPTR